MVTIGVVALACAICGAYIYVETRRLQLVQNRVRLKVYDELLHAVTEINIAGEDEYKMDLAKKHLAYILNRLNLVAGPRVLVHVNELLDFLNQAQESGFDVLKQLNILNKLVQAARQEMDPESARVLEEAQFRFRFYNPPRG